MRCPPGTPTPSSRVVGNPVPRIDGAKRVSGAARFTVDVQLPRMLHAAVLRSPVANARRRAARPRGRARARPGVRAVIGPDEAIGEGPLAADRRRPSSSARRSRSSPPRRSIRPARRSRCWRRQIDALPFEVDLEEGLRAQRFTNEPSEHAARRARALTSRATSASSSSSRRSSTSRAPLEPHAAVADWQEDELTVWSSTQGIFAVRDELAARFGLPPSQRPRDRRVRRRRLRRKVDARRRGRARRRALAPRAPAGQPRASRRHEEQLAGGHRPATRQTRPAGGRPRRHARRLRARRRDRDGIARGTWCRRSTGRRCSPTRSANAHAMRFPVKLNLRPVNAFRGPGYVEGTTAYEQAIDELAAALELDPLELRRRLHVDHDQGSRPAVFVEVAARLLRPRRRALGLGRRASALRDAPRRATACCAGSAARRRCGSAPRGRRASARSASAPTGSRPSSPGSRTSAPAR